MSAGGVGRRDPRVSETEDNPNLLLPSPSHPRNEGPKSDESRHRGTHPPPDRPFPDEICLLPPEGSSPTNRPMGHCPLSVGASLGLYGVRPNSDPKTPVTQPPSSYHPRPSPRRPSRLCCTRHRDTGEPGPIDFTLE